MMEEVKNGKIREDGEIVENDQTTTIDFRAEIKETIKESQLQWKRDIKLMMDEYKNEKIREEGETVRKEQESTRHFISELKEEFKSILITNLTE